MEVRVGSTTISLIRGDIPVEDTDAIVNAANTRLAGGGGVDGAIHRAGGHRIKDECRKIGRCPTGGAVLTIGGNLKARFVIHAVGPIYKDGKHGEAGHLKDAYEASLRIAKEKGLKSVAFPSISTGAYGYPIEEAAEIALKTVMGFVKENRGFELVRFVLFSDQDLKVYEERLKEASM